jgi:integrase
LRDGSRPWIPLDPALGPDDVEGARRLAAQVSLNAAHFVAAHVKETVSEYAKRWLASREGRVRSNGDSRSHLDTHILPVLGPLDMQAVGRVEVEGFVAKLDAKVQAGTMSAKTAKNLWGTCSKMFDDATNAKPATGLRCLDADPTQGVRGPDDNDGDKELQFLYPSEFLTFMACREVPRRWRRDVAIAIYLCLRDGEQRALGWPSVDLEHAAVHVAETYDRRTGEVRAGTKSGTARTVPIPAALLPLLRAMRAEAQGKGLVGSRGATRHLARDLRRWLTVAGVNRPALHEGTTASKPLRWHDLRATGLTWLAVQGRPATEIRDIAGHTMTAMTDRYMRAAGVLRGGRFGDVFPTLPDPSDLLLGVSSLNRLLDDSQRAKYAKGKAYMVEAPGIEHQRRQIRQASEMLRIS